MLQVEHHEVPSEAKWLIKQFETFQNNLEHFELFQIILKRFKTF